MAKERNLRKKVLYGLITASILSISNNPYVWAASGDYAGQGKVITDESLADYSGKKVKVIGGWDIYPGNETNNDTSNTSTSINITKGTFDDIIGGSHIKQPTKDYTDKKYDISIGKTSINIAGGEFTGTVIGGSKANNSDNTILTVGNVNMNITGGAFNSAIIGGSNLKATGNPGGGTPAQSKSTTGNITVNISGGTFESAVYGGSVADNYGSVQTGGKPILTATDKSTNLTITGGEFKNGIYGAGMANGTSSIVNVDTAKLTIDDKNSEIKISGGRIFGGGEASNGGTMNVANTEVAIYGLKAGDYAKALYAGSNNNGVSGTTKLIIKDSVLGNGNNKWGIYGGSRINDISGITIGDAQDMYINIENSNLATDVRGGAGLFSQNTKVINGDSEVIVKNTTIDGYSSEINDWSGRIFGAGILEKGNNSTLEHNTAKVLVENVGGKTYDADKGEAVVNENPGAEIYGGGQLYWSQNAILNVNNTDVTIDGADTSLNSVYGGNTISGTIPEDKSSVAIAGNTNVVVNNGNITSFLVAGNTTNWFGTSVIGILDDEKGKYEYNGHKYNEGSTKVTLNAGGNAESLSVVGGSTSTYSSYYNQNGKREAIVFGNTEANINGGEAYEVVGGGYAYYSYSGNIDKEKLKDKAPISDVYGNTNVNINGGIISTNVTGGGYATSTHSELASQANVYGDTNITINDGEIKGNVIAGGFADSYDDGNIDTDKIQANVTGKATINLKNGKIDGDIIVGGYAKGNNASATVNEAILVYEGGTIGGDIISTAKTANVNIKTNGFQNDFIAQNGTMNIWGDIKFINTNNLKTDNGTINLAGGNMSGVLNITEGSVNLNGATFTTNDIAKDITGGGKLVLKDNGILSTTADQVFTKDNQSITSKDIVNNLTNTDKITFESGTVNLTDEEYTLDFVDSAVETMKNYKYDDKNSSNTSVVMSGNLISEIGENKVTVNQASGIGDEVALDKVTVNADGKSLLVGANHEVNGNVAGIDNINQSVANGFNAGSLDLETGSTGMVITNDKNVTLGGSQGGNIITVGDAEPEDFTVVVGLGSGDKVDGVTNKKGSFTIGNALATDNTAYTLNGSVVVNDNSELTTNGQTTITKDITLNNGTVTVNKGTLTVQNINVGNEQKGVKVLNSEGISGNITGNVKAEVLNLNTNSTTNNNVILNIGNADNAGDLTVQTATLNGGTVFLDPVWKDGSTINGASAMAVVNTNEINGNYVVGQNSILGFGVENTDILRNNFAKTGLTWGKNNITAGLYLDKSINLTKSGSINVNGALTESPDEYTKGNVNFGANSILIINGNNIKGDTVALTGVSSVSVDKDNEEKTAKLYIDEAKKGKTYKILEGTDINSADVWENNNIISNNALLKFEGTKTETNYDVTASYDKVDNIYGAGNVVINNVIDNTLANKDEGNKAYDFFNKAANNKINVTKEMQVSALNSLANMGELASVNHGTYSMSNVMTDAVADHVKDDKNTGDNIWARYIHNKEDINGISLGGMKADYDATFNGIIVGSDFAKTEKSTTGVSFAYAEGDIKGNTLASRTENDADYYGLSVYHQIKNNDGSSVLGDISYMHSSNDVTQYNSGETITASPDADAFSIGVRAQKDVKVGKGTLSPYAGIRYMHLGTGDYTNSLGMNYDVEDQNLWLLPVGVSYSTEIKYNDWTVKPMAEVGYMWTMGDRQTDQTVSLYGAADSFGFDVADNSSFFGKLGVTAENDKIAYGIAYQYQKGDTVDANQWIANVEFKF